MATLTKFYPFIASLCNGAHNLQEDSLQLTFSNEHPFLTDTYLSDISEIDFPYLSTSPLVVNYSVETQGTYRLIIDYATFFSLGGSTGPFQYIVLYNATNELVIGYYDLGQPITLADGDKLVLNFDQIEGALKIGFGEAPAQGLATIDNLSRYYYVDKKTRCYADINPNGSDTQVELLYGSTTDYGNTITGELLTGSVPISTNILIPQLWPGTYHFIFKMTNSEGVSYSADQILEIYPGTSRDIDYYTSELDAAIATMNGTTYYIDPTSTEIIENGTIQYPYKTWGSGSFPAGLGGNNIYLQKRGTTCVLPGRAPNSFVGPCMMGVYGEGTERAKIAQSSSGNCIASNYKTIVKDLELEGYEKTPGYSGGTAITLGNQYAEEVVGHLVYGCKINYFDFGIGFNQSTLWYSGAKAFHTEIAHIRRDGIYPNEVTDIEIGYCYFHDINEAWFVDHNDGTSSGDAIQVGFRNQTFMNIHCLVSIHHCTFERVVTRNKFAIIVNEIYANGEISHIYNNHFISAVGPSSGANPVSAIYTGLPTWNGPADSEVYVYNNLFEDGAFGVRNYCKKIVQIYNNIFLRCDSAIGLTNFGWTSGPQVLIANNLFVNCVAVSTAAGSPATVSSHNNYFSSPTVLYHYASTSGLIASDNNHFNLGNIAPGYSTLTQWKTTGRDQVSESGNPYFNNETLQDYRLLPESTLFDTGKDVGITFDFDGDPVIGDPSKGIYDKLISEIIPIEQKILTATTKNFITIAPEVNLNINYQGQILNTLTADVRNYTITMLPATLSVVLTGGIPPEPPYLDGNTTAWFVTDDITYYDVVSGDVLRLYDKIGEKSLNTNFMPTIDFQTGWTAINATALSATTFSCTLAGGFYRNLGLNTRGVYSFTGSGLTNGGALRTYNASVVSNEILQLFASPSTKVFTGVNDNFYFRNSTPASLVQVTSATIRRYQGNNLVQNTLANQPDLVTDAISFNGTTDYLQSAIDLSLNYQKIFIVAQKETEDYQLYTSLTGLGEITQGVLTLGANTARTEYYRITIKEIIFRNEDNPANDLLFENYLKYKYNISSITLLSRMPFDTYVDISGQVTNITLPLPIEDGIWNDELIFNDEIMFRTRISDTVRIYVEYGLTDTYGEQIEVNESPMDEINDITVSISNLEPNTEYHFRFKLIDEYILYSPDYTFTTQSYILPDEVTDINNYGYYNYRDYSNRQDVVNYISQFRDLSKGNVEGEELSPNGGTFDSETGYSLSTGWSISNGKLIGVTGAASNLVVDPSNQKAHAVYNFGFEVSQISGSWIMTNYHYPNSIIYNPGTYLFNKIATGNYSGLRKNSTTACEIDNLTQKRVLGNHLTQFTADAQPAISGEYITFDGVDDYLRSAIETTFVGTIYILCQRIGIDQDFIVLNNLEGIGEYNNNRLTIGANDSLTIFYNIRIKTIVVRSVFDPTDVRDRVNAKLIEIF